MKASKTKRFVAVGISMICMMTSIPLLFASPAKAAGEEFVMGIFYVPTNPYTNATQYDYIKDANINVLQTFYPNTNQPSTIAEMTTVLDLARDRGMKVQVSDTRSEYLMGTRTGQPQPPASDTDIDAIANSYKNHPATAGYYIQDEPHEYEFPRAAYVYQRFLLNHPESMSNVNMFPDSGVPGGSSEHLSYMKKWVTTVGASKLEYLSMDTYPFKDDGSIGSYYYQDLANLRAAGLSYNLKTAAYLQANGDNLAGYRRPNANELRWNVYNNLAFGVKGLYWFTWFQPEIYTPNNFTPAIMDGNGNKTDLYIPAQTLGGEVKQLGSTLMGLTSRDVYFKGTIPSGTSPIPANYFWNPTTAYDQIVSHFANEDGRSYVMVVNRDYANSKTLSFNLPSKPSAVTEISKSTGGEVSTNYSNATGNISSTFLPGEGKLYAISTDFILPSSNLNDSDAAIRYSGSSWYHSMQRGVGNYGDDVHHASDNDDYVEFTFIGTGVDFVTEKDPSGGNLDIYIDNVFQQTVSTYSAVSHLAGQTVYSKTGLSNGPHTIKAVKKSGTYMVLDHFKVTPGSIVRTASKTNDNDAGITYSGAGWGYSSGRGSGDYGNDLHYTTANNDYFEYTFTGTGVDFITDMDTSGGNVDIYIDNILQQTVSTLSTSTHNSQQAVYSKTGLSYGTHTIKGIKKSGIYMVVDGFHVYKGSNLLANPGYESGTTTSWSTPYAGMLTTSSTDKHTGTYSAKITGRTQLYSSPAQDVTTLLLTSGQGKYHLSGWLKLAVGASDRAQIAIRLEDSLGTQWVNTDWKTIKSTEWTQSSKTLNIAWTGKLTSATLYVQTEAYGYDLYFDDFVLSR
ncbi:carbohydrate binding domain-containing protein [Paenibacillus sp. CC-CFT747]|nr:carbohydrate binding domain-containing protein [Paenibacillus sp. CC-CFT747]